MQILVQKKNELNAEKAIEFIRNCKKSKLAIVHSSVRNGVDFLNFFDVLVRKLKIPFVGMRVSGTLTQEGHSEDSVAIAVLCGDFDMRVLHERMNYEKPEDTAELMIPELKDHNLCLIYSANPIKRDILVDAILRGIQASNPDLQIFGGVSASPPILVTNEGVHEDTMVFIPLKGVDFDFEIDSGFRFDESKDTKFVITKSDEHHIYEIDGKNAVEEYSKIQCMRPYFINMLANLFPRPDVARVMKLMSRLNKVVYEGVLGMCIHVLGAELDGKTAEFLFAMELNEKGDYMVVQSYKPKGTVLRRLSTSPKEQLSVYERLYEKFPKAEAMIISSCYCRLFWFDFDFRALEKKLKRFKCPFMVSYVYGGFGTRLPYKDSEKNVLHGGTVKALVFK